MATGGTSRREAIRRRRQETGERLSFFAWIVKCIAQAVSEHREVNAYRGRRGIVVFEDVDISIPVEKTVEGAKVPAPCVVRKAQNKTMAQIQAEVRAAQAEDLSGGYHTPGQGRNPLAGWVGVVLALCSVVRQPGVVGDRVEVREYLNLTVLIDHDIVDGMPAARFLSRLAELVEGGFGLDPESDAGGPAGRKAQARPFAILQNIAAQKADDAHLSSQVNRPSQE